MGRTQFIAAYQTEAGRTAKNQDFCDVFDVALSDGRSGPRRTIKVAVVADGINGHQGGDVASKITVETIKSTFHEIDTTILETMQRAIQRANENIFDNALKQPKLRGMGCTVVMAVLDTSQLYIAHVGDSRAYLIRRGKIHQLTEDHVRESRGAPSTTQLTRRLGRTAKVNVDLAYIPLNNSHIQSEPRVGSVPLQRGDSILLCTDGLTDVLSDNYLQSIVAGARSPKVAAQRLLSKAKSAGASDDMTAVVVRWPRWSGRTILFWLSVLLIGFLWLGSERIGNMAGSFCGRYKESGENFPVLKNLPICYNTQTVTPSPTLMTETPTTIVTMTSTSTPFSTPTPVNTDITRPATATSQPAIIAPAPTNMQIPAHTPTPKPTRIEIPTATATPRPTATYTPMPDVTATPTSLSATLSTTVEPSVTVTLTPLLSETPAGQTSEAKDICYEDVISVDITLQQPADGATSPNDQVFVWTVNCNLGPNQAFEPIFWLSGENPAGKGRGLVGTTLANTAVIGTQNANALGVGNIDLLWSVRIVQSDPYNELVYPYDAVKAVARHYKFVSSVDGD